MGNFTEMNRMLLRNVIDKTSNCASRVLSQGKISVFQHFVLLFGFCDQTITWKWFWCPFMINNAYVSR